jgi:hypothetical protein
MISSQFAILGEGGLDHVTYPPSPNFLVLLFSICLEYLQIASAGNGDNSKLATVRGH